MDRAKLIPNGGSQAVRLPKEYRFEGEEVGIGKVGDVVVLIPEDKTSYETMRMAVDMFTDDFMVERDQPPVQDRGLAG